MQSCRKRRAEAGTVTRIPAAEVEALIIGKLREHLAATIALRQSIPERELIERYAQRIVVKAHAVELHVAAGEAEHLCHVDSDSEISGASMPPGQTREGAAAVLHLPWTTASFSAAKGILHEERSSPAMKPETRDALLTAIAKARVWIDDLVQGRAASLADIAERESKGERHVRLLASSPRTESDHAGNIKKRFPRPRNHHTSVKTSTAEISSGPRGSLSN